MIKWMKVHYNQNTFIGLEVSHFWTNQLFWAVSYSVQLDIYPYLYGQVKPKNKASNRRENAF